jgi:hypothetical protein
MKLESFQWHNASIKFHAVPFLISIGMTPQTLFPYK